MTTTGMGSPPLRKREKSFSKNCAPFGGRLLTSMPNSDASLSPHLFTAELPEAPTRDGFGTGVVAAGEKDPRVMVLCADLAESTRADAFQTRFPDRFVEMGITEQHMAAAASGMAAVGAVPFIASYAAFSPGRNYEQIRTTIALNQSNVKVCGMHAGISVGPDGATHQMLEDVGLMRMIPGMTVIAPMDAEEARKAVLAAAGHEGPVYLRFGRAPTPVLSTEATPFTLGKALPLWRAQTRPDVAILSTGALAYEALRAARDLQKEGVEVHVIHFPTIKPLDTEAVCNAAREARRIVTVEEHQVFGGFGSAVAEVLAENLPVPIRFVGVRDRFGQSGTPSELLREYEIDARAVCESVHACVRDTR